MPSRDFAIRIYGERLTARQRAAIGVTGSLMLYVAARADAQSHTAHVNLEEFAVWAGCSYSAARQAWDRLEALGIVLDVKRRAHGFICTLGEAYQKADTESTVAVKVYEKVHRRRPHSQEREAISRIVGMDTADLKLWRATCESWKGNPADTPAMLEAFERKRKAARVLGRYTAENAENAKRKNTEPPGLRD